jgi:hypothetical protein
MKKIVLTNAPIQVDVTDAFSAMLRTQVHRYAAMLLVRVSEGEIAESTAQIMSHHAKRFVNWIEEQD